MNEPEGNGAGDFILWLIVVACTGVGVLFSLVVWLAILVVVLAVLVLMWLGIASLL